MGRSKGKKVIGRGDRPGRFRWTWPGLFTVEAAVLYSIITLLIAFMLYLCIDWYGNVQTAAMDTEELRELDTRSYFLDNVAQIISR